MIYRGARDQAEYFRRSGYLCAGLSLGLLVTIPWLPDRLPVSVAVGSSAVLAALMVLCRFLFVQLERESVEITESGIRRGDSPFIPWERLSDIRERPLVRRVELLDRAGAVLVRLPYEIEYFSDALENVLDQMDFEPARGPFAAGRQSPMVMGSLVVVLLGVSLWLSTGDPSPLFLILLAVLGPLAEWAEGPPTYVSVSADHIVVRRWRGELRYRTGAVTDVSFDPRTLDIVLSIGEGISVGVRPRGVNPFGMFLTVRAAALSAAA